MDFKSIATSPAALLAYGYLAGEFRNNGPKIMFKAAVNGGKTLLRVPWLRSYAENNPDEAKADIDALDAGLKAAIDQAIAEDKAAAQKSLDDAAAAKVKADADHAAASMAQVDASKAQADASGKA